MEYKTMARNPSSGGADVWQLSLSARSSSESLIPVGLSQCGASCQSGSACPGFLCLSTESRAPLCVSSHCFIPFPPATGWLQCQRDVSIINVSPLLMRFQLLHALTHQPTPQLQAMLLRATNLRQAWLPLAKGHHGAILQGLGKETWLVRCPARPPTRAPQGHGRERGKTHQAGKEGLK